MTEMELREEIRRYEPFNEQERRIRRRSCGRWNRQTIS